MIFRRRFTLRARGKSQRGFTLLELIVVAAMLGILAAIAMPQLIDMPRRARESVLRNNLQTIRRTIDEHYADKGFYPPDLETLTEDGYLRQIPWDPIVQHREWELIFEEQQTDDFVDFEGDVEDSVPGVIDVHSLSEDAALDGTLYSEW